MIVAHPWTSQTIISRDNNFVQSIVIVGMKTRKQLLHSKRVLIITYHWFKNWMFFREIVLIY